MNDNNNNFNKKEFAFLLNKAKGNRSINKYASDSNVSAAHISRFLREKISAPPTPETISKLTKTAQNEVSYEDLMSAAGHIYLTKGIESQALNKEKNERLEKEIFLSFVSALYSSDYKWSINKETMYNKYTYLKLVKDSKDEWNIIFQANVTPETIVYTYGHFAMLDINLQSKISIVVINESEFNLFVNMPPKSINGCFSVVLLDNDNNKIIKEKILSKN